MAQRYGRYEVLARIGAGGMGEVYRARDSELKRDVALKILREKIQSDPQQQKRFLLEARSASALNHPNIVTVHDVGSEDGVSYIVSEFVEGQSLRALLASNISTRKIIDLAVDVASALAAAHRAGIIHRDLKPENVMITSDGRAKLLDFGLAKWLQPENPTDPQETVSALISQEGIIRGTVPYMSPEQAAGREVDFRTDQFSFGCVLYEMLTRKRPFDRQTPAQTLSAIIEEDPPPIAASDRVIPPPLRWVIERCLAKEPAQRYDSTGDLYRDLQKIQQYFSETTSSEILPASKRRSFHLSSWVAYSLLPVAVLGGLLWGRTLNRNVPPVFHRLTFRHGSVLRPRFGPDGRTVYYTAVWEGGKYQPYVTRVDNPESTALSYQNAVIEAVSDAGDIAIDIDPDASDLLATASLAGGAPRQLATHVEFSDWSPVDHRLLVTHRIEGRVRLEFPIGNVLYDPGTGSVISYPRFSPDGQRIGFIQVDASGEYSIRLLELNKKVKILSGGWGDAYGLAWTPKGNEIWFGAREVGGTSGGLILRGVDLSGHVRTVAGVPGLLIIGDIAKDGRVLVTDHSWPGVLMCKGPGATSEHDLSWFDESLAEVISEDGKKVVFQEGGFAGGNKGSVYIRDTDGTSPAVKLSDGRPFALSPDGRWVMVDLAPISGICTMVPTGPGQPHNLDTNGLDCFNARWLPDHQTILFFGKPKQSRSARWYRTDMKATKPVAITPEEGAGQNAVLSSDGKYLVWKNERGELKQYATEQSKEEDLSLKLSPDEELLSVRNDENAIYASTGQFPVQVYRYDMKSGAKQLWKELSPNDRSGVTSLDVFLAPQANAYCYSFIRSLSDLYVVQGLK